MQAFTDALAAIAAGTGRLERVQLLLSDPTTEPLGALDRKSAFGAYDRASTAVGQPLAKSFNRRTGVRRLFLKKPNIFSVLLTSC